MLHSYNPLHPYQYKAVAEDPFVAAAVSRLSSHEAIIEANTATSKSGLILLPCIIIDTSASTFMFQDGLGNTIDSEIVKVNMNGAWTNVSYTGDIDTSEAVYSLKGLVVFLQIKIAPVLFNKTVTGTPRTDGMMFSKTYYQRLEFLYNSRLGCTLIETDSTIISFDSVTGVMETDNGTFTLDYPSAVTNIVGDVVLGGTFVDKVSSLVKEPPYIKVVIKKEYGYIKNIFTFDSNKKIELID